MNAAVEKFLSAEPWAGQRFDLRATAAIAARNEIDRRIRNLKREMEAAMGQMSLEELVAIVAEMEEGGAA